MSEHNQRLSVWMGVAFAPLLFLGLAIAGFIPPPAPTLDANAIASMFDEDRTAIRIGIWITTAASPLLAFFVASLSHLIRQIAGTSSPMATAQTVAGSCLILEFIFPQMLWQACAFRAERAPELLLLLNDVAWLCYMGVVGTAIVQMLVLALVILQDPRKDALVPRWAAFLCLWSAVGVAGGSFCVFVQTGPIAWNGLISWWLLAVSFTVWMFVMAHQMLRVSRRTEAEAGR